MFVILIVCAVPVAAALMFAWFCRSAGHPSEAMEGPARLAAEIARRGDRTGRRGSELTARRRHLAAVLPADARR